MAGGPKPRHSVTLVGGAVSQIINYAARGGEGRFTCLPLHHSVQTFSSFALEVGKERAEWAPSLSGCTNVVT